MKTLNFYFGLKLLHTVLMHADKAKVDAQKLEIDGPVLPRKQKPPRDRELGSGEGDQSSLPVDYYRSIYYETLDTVMASVTD